MAAAPKRAAADRQDAGAAAVIQHALAARRMPGDPAQAHAGGRMGAGAEGQTGVEADHLPGLGRRFVPGRHDPEFRGDLHRCELGLRQPHPVLVGHRGNPEHLAAGKEILRLQQQQCLRRGGLAFEQRQHAGPLPACLWAAACRARRTAPARPRSARRRLPPTHSARPAHPARRSAPRRCARDRAGRVRTSSRPRARARIRARLPRSGRAAGRHRYLSWCESHSSR